jgi:hypothetical protein
MQIKAQAITFSSVHIMPTVSVNVDLIKPDWNQIKRHMFVIIKMFTLRILKESISGLLLKLVYSLR